MSEPEELCPDSNGTEDQSASDWDEEREYQHQYKQAAQIYNLLKKTYRQRKREIENHTQLLYTRQEALRIEAAKIEEQEKALEVKEKNLQVHKTQIETRIKELEKKKHSLQGLETRKNAEEEWLKQHTREQQEQTQNRLSKMSQSTSLPGDVRTMPMTDSPCKATGQIENEGQQTPRIEDITALLPSINKALKRTIIMPIDKNLAPRPFSGKSDENGAQFMNRFEQYMAVIDEVHLTKHLPLYLKGSPELWYNGYIKQNLNIQWKELREEFLKKFGPEARGYISQSQLISRQQGVGESVEDYSHDIMQRLSIAGLTEPNLWQTFVKGLRPQMQARVLARHPLDIHTALMYATETEELLKLENQDSIASLNMLDTKAWSKGMKPVLQEIVSESLNSIQLEGQGKSPISKENGESYCKFCQNTGHSYSDCRTKFRVLKCFICNKTGHFQMSCPRNWQNDYSPQNTLKA
jgi:hypothetical protein